MFKSRAKDSIWQARNTVIELQRWVSTIEPADDETVVDLRRALSSARDALERMGVRDG